MKELGNITVLNIHNLFTVSSPKGRHETIQSRPCYGISFCMEGQITYIHNGVNYVSRPGVAILLPQGETYTLLGDKKGLFPVINFTVQEPLSSHHVVIPLTDEDAFLRDYEKMRALFGIPGTRARILSLFYGMLHRLSRTEGDSVIAPAVHLVYQGYGDPTLSNAALAARCRISEGYLRKLFLRQYGTTPKQFILDVRTEKAKQLLREGAHKILSVSERCGFASPYHFCRAFKKQTGITPTEYMLQNRSVLL